jgi:hypothetical protein
MKYGEPFVVKEAMAVEDIVAMGVRRFRVPRGAVPWTARAALS